MSGHIFVNETKHNDYLLVAVVGPMHSLSEVRGVLRGLVLPGQRRLHMKSESDRRKRLIASAVVRAGISATVYDAGRRYLTERDRRAACLRLLVEDAKRRGDTMVILEQDDSLVAWDRRVLYNSAHQAGVTDSLRYEHQRASTEPLLALPDSVAWCWAKGGDWHRRIASVVEEVRRA